MRLNRKELYLLLACLCLSLVIVFQVHKTKFAVMGVGDINKDYYHKIPEFCSSVDVVYTWVNGSDPAHKKLLREYGKNWDGGYRDYGVIRYSVRSIAKYMPWVRNIVIITNGQVPNWVNVSSPRLRLVTHDQIFENPKEALPTFNSNAIEANIRNIPDLAPCILYLNDDMFLAAPVKRDTFFNSEGHLKLPMSSGFVAPMEEKMKKSIWHRLMAHSNDIFNSYYYPDSKKIVKHPYPAHTCYFMRTDILQTIGTRWHKEFEETSKHKFRQADYAQTPFLQANVAIQEFKAKKTNIPGIYGTWTKDSKKNNDFWKKVWTGRNICVCMNDNLDNTPGSFKEIDRLQELFEAKLPEKSFIEI